MYIFYERGDAYAGIANEGDSKQSKITPLKGGIKGV